jgi:uncharacterized membrane protein YhaH (DUF805 family)
MSLFSLSGRIGRVRYVLLSLGLVLGSAVPAVLAAGLLTTLARSRAGLVLAFVLGVGIGLTLAWSTLALQVRRCRDIGWDPWLVIGGWMALGLFDIVVARLAPAVALGANQHGTVLGAAANLLLLGALLFWPGREADVGPSPNPAPRLRPEPLRDAPVPAPVRVPARPVPAGPARASFGRR